MAAPSHRFPPPLRPGDKVRIIAPSGRFDLDRLQRGLDALRAIGLVPLCDHDVATQYLYFAGDDARRGSELQAAILEPQTRAIWAARGGYGAARLLHTLDAERIKEANKWLVGYSDITALHALWGRAGLGSLHAANITGVDTWSALARNAMFGLLMGERSIGVQGEALCPGPRVEGRLVGGNLTVLASLCGTGQLPSFRGAILFLEDVSERPYRLDRSATQLLRSGALEGVLGIAIGQLTDCTPVKPGDPDAPTALLSALSSLDVPIVAGLPVGHEDATSLPLPLGGAAVLDATQATLHVSIAP